MTPYERFPVGTVVQIENGNIGVVCLPPTPEPPTSDKLWAMWRDNYYDSNRPLFIRVTPNRIITVLKPAEPEVPDYNEEEWV